MILSADADALLQEVVAVLGNEFSACACATVESARRQYAGQSILLGDPDLVAQVLSEFPQVAWVQSTWAGVTPLIEHKRRDYQLSNVRDVFGPQISEYVMGYLLAHELKVFDRVEHQEQRRWFTDTSGQLQGKRLGIMGTGSIGRHLAGVATGLGMAVTGLNRTGAAAEHFGAVMAVEQLHPFLRGLDYLVAALPNTADTNQLLDDESLACLPRQAYFINVGRSNVVDDNALCVRLRSQLLAGAVLDVFDDEPLSASSELWNTPNLKITAHIAAVSHPHLIAPIFADNYRRFMSNRPLLHVVDFTRGY